MTANVRRARELKDGPRTVQEVVESRIDVFGASGKARP
jgi:hypothetical protein